MPATVADMPGPADRVPLLPWMRTTWISLAACDATTAYALPSPVTNASTPEGEPSLKSPPSVALPAGERVPLFSCTRSSWTAGSAAAATIANVSLPIPMAATSAAPSSSRLPPSVALPAGERVPLFSCTRSIWTVWLEGEVTITYVALPTANASAPSTPPRGRPP